MQVHCDEGVATRIGPEPCVAAREGGDEASVGEHAGWVLSRENMLLGADPVSPRGRPRDLPRERDEVKKKTATVRSRLRRRPALRQPETLGGVLRSVKGIIVTEIRTPLPIT